MVSDLQREQTVLMNNVIIPDQTSNAGPEERKVIIYDHLYVAEENLKALSRYRDDDLVTERAIRINLAEKIKDNMDVIISMLGGK
jgi:hypothetical protein